MTWLIWFFNDIMNVQGSVGMLAGQLTADPEIANWIPSPITCLDIDPEMVSVAIPPSPPPPTSSSGSCTVSESVREQCE